MRFIDIFRKITNFFKNKAGKKKDYFIRTVDIHFSDIPHSIYIVVKKYGWVAFFFKSVNFIKTISVKYPKKYKNKILDLKESFFRSVKEEGWKIAAVRLKNYLFWGKGVFNTERLGKKEKEEKGGIYCLAGDGVKRYNILGQIEKFLRNNNKEVLLIVSHDASNSGAPILASKIAKTLNKDYEKKIIIICIKGGPLESDFEKFGLVINLNQTNNNNLADTDKIDSIFEFIRKQGAEKC